MSKNSLTAEKRIELAKEYLSGETSIEQIAIKLTEEKVLTPTEYAKHICFRDFCGVPIAEVICIIILTVQTPI